MSRLDVHLHVPRVGVLERVEQSRLRFTYRGEPEALRGLPPLSLSLPLRREPFSDEECRGFFSGLLPEGGFLRAVARAFGVSASNPFAVLEAIGGECAGAISLAPPGAGPPSPREPWWPSPFELVDVLQRSPGRVLQAGVGDHGEGLRLSLAGAQDKLPVVFAEGRIGITRGNPPSTHIVKLPIEGFPDTVANEQLCLALARASGLDAAEAVARRADGEQAKGPHLRYLLVTRYDRRAEPPARLHQEDVCQALGVPPELKYQAEGGPTVADCASLIARHSAVPARDRLAFADALIFNLLIGNHDAHAKNYSLMLEGPDAPRLAPLYDLLSTSVYPDLSRKLAMKLGGENRPVYIRGRHLDRLAGELNMRPRAFRRRAADLAARVTAALPEVAERLATNFDHPSTLQHITDQVQAAARRLRSALAEPSSPGS